MIVIRMLGSKLTHNMLFHDWIPQSPKKDKVQIGFKIIRKRLVTVTINPVKLDTLKLR